MSKKAEKNEQPVWSLHWYAHIINPQFGLISMDHTGVIQNWSRPDRPHLGERIYFDNEDSKFQFPYGRYVGDPVFFHGTVVDIMHNSHVIGGNMCVYTDHIFVRDYPDAEIKEYWEYVSDDIYAQIKEQRKLILMGQLMPEDSVTYTINLK